MALAAENGRVRHPFGIRIRLLVAACDRDDVAPRPCIHTTRDRRALSARRALPYLGRVCRLLPACFGSACPGYGRTHYRRAGMSPAEAPTEGRHHERLLRLVLPFVVLALFIAAWHAVVAYYQLPPFKLPGPR